MKKSKEILRDPPPDFRLDLALTMVVVGMALIAMGSVACAQDVSLQIEVSDPDANGTMHLKGSVVCTGLHPEGQQIVTNDVWVHVEYMMDDGGKWPIFYEWWNHYYKCYRIGERCITDEERHGVHVQGGGVLLSKSLEDSDACKSFSFEKDLKPPTNATRARVVAHLEHTLTSGAAYWVAHQDFWDSASFDILRPNPDSDGDGVPDDKDKCSGTPAGVAVDDKGCPIKPTISLDPSSGPPMTEVTVSGTGFESYEKISIKWDSETGEELCSVTADSGGSFSVQVKVPKNASVHTIYAVGAVNTASATFSVTVLKAYFTLKYCELTVTGSLFATFDASGSTPEQDIDEYLWDFGDGKTESLGWGSRKHPSGANQL